MFDSTLLAAVAAEMQPLVGTRLRDIWLGEGGDTRNPNAEGRALYLAFSGATLLIDTHPQRARLHLTRNPVTPATIPTPFLESTRRILRGAHLVGKVQPHFDRILHLPFATRDAIGNAQKFTLVAELMDRRSNVVLLDENDVIVDALKRLPPFLNRERTILPHLPYKPPPGARENPLEAEDWPSLLADAPLEFPDFPAWLRARFAGISPLVARFLQSRIAGGVSPQQACAEFFDLARRAAAGDFAPVLCGAQPYPFALDGECAGQTQTLSELIEAQVGQAAQVQELEAARAALLSHLARRDKRVAAQRDDVDNALRQAESAETWKQHGQLLLSHLGEVEAAAARGDNFVELCDAWTNEKVRLNIEPNWPAADNATRLFNRYKRAQRLSAGAPQRQKELDAESAQIAAWRASTQAAQTRDELARLGDEAQMQALRKSVSRTREQSESARPESKLRRNEIAGWTVFMGRSALENQLLLSKIASPSDIWMHVRAMPSAHVLIKNQKGKTPPPKVLEEAARWLAMMTRVGKKNAGERLEIIYTPAKWVRSVKGAPGKVTLQRFETIDVTI